MGRCTQARAVGPRCRLTRKRRRDLLAHYPILQPRIVVLIAEEQDCIPPLGWLADILTLTRADLPRMESDRGQADVLTPGLRRQYEDLLFSRFVHEPAVQRAIRAVRSYDEKDVTRAAASLMEMMAEQIGDTSRDIRPTAIRRLQRGSTRPDELLSLNSVEESVLVEVREHFQSFLDSLQSVRTPIHQLQIRLYAGSHSRIPFPGRGRGRS